MSELVKRLRKFVDDPNYGILGTACVAMGEAASRIEALETALEDALDFLGGVDDAWQIRDRILQALPAERPARAALKQD